MKASVFIATSVDGFIARPDGDIDWLSSGSGGESEEDHGYGAFIESVDVLVMGRNTYEKVLTFGAWPYGEKPVIVLSSQQPLHLPEDITGTVESMSAEPREVVRRLAERGARHLYVDGGMTIQRFLAEGLIQQLIITRVPILIGSGIPLFGSIPKDIRLRHITTETFKSGLVQTRYEIVR